MGTGKHKGPASGDPRSGSAAPRMASDAAQTRSHVAEQAKTQPIQVNEIAEGLSRVLADSYLLYLKTQNFHWNVTGPAFYQLHTAFQGQYEELFAANDEIAERIRALGFPAPGTFSEFTELSAIRESRGQTDGMEMARLLRSDQSVILRTLRNVIEVAKEAGDEATTDLLTRRIAAHEKNAWMLRSQVE